MLKQNQDAFA